MENPHYAEKYRQQRQVFAEAKKLIEQGWIRGDLAQDKDGKSVDPSDPSACQFCLLGALYKACEEIGVSYRLVGIKLAGNLPVWYVSSVYNGGRSAIAHYNNDPGRTKEEIINLLDSLSKE